MLGMDEQIEQFVKMSETIDGSVKVILPLISKYGDVCPDAIGRIQYASKGSRSSKYRPLFIKNVKDLEGNVLGAEDYAFFGARGIELGFSKLNGHTEVYGEIVFGTDGVPASKNLEVFIEFM